MRLEFNDVDATEVVKEAFWLAWLAAGGPLGMGMFQDRPDATKDDVWANIANKGDYAGMLNDNKDGHFYADYVFGRMLKLGLKWGPGWVEFGSGQVRSDYRSWARKYPTYAALVDAALDNVRSARLAA